MVPNRQTVTAYLKSWKVIIGTNKNISNYHISNIYMHVPLPIKTTQECKLARETNNDTNRFNVAYSLRPKKVDVFFTLDIVFDRSPYLEIFL